MSTRTEEMESALRGINFFVGGLTEDGIKYYYHKLIQKLGVNNNA